MAARGRKATQKTSSAVLPRLQRPSWSRQRQRDHAHCLRLQHEAPGNSQSLKEAASGMRVGRRTSTASPEGCCNDCQSSGQAQHVRHPIASSRTQEKSRARQERSNGLARLQGRLHEAPKTTELLPSLGCHVLFSGYDEQGLKPGSLSGF